MKIENTIPDLLFPIQPRIIDKKYSEIKKKLSSGSESKLIPVVKYNNGFLMLDGHNTVSYLLYERNKRILGISIQETDNEAFNYFRGALSGIKTIDEFVEKYEKEFRKRCEEAGIINSWDLRPPIINEKKRSYFC